MKAIIINNVDENLHPTQEMKFVFLYSDDGVITSDETYKDTTSYHLQASEIYTILPDHTMQKRTEIDFYGYKPNSNIEFIE